VRHLGATKGTDRERSEAGKAGVDPLRLGRGQQHALDGAPVRRGPRVGDEVAASRWNLSLRMGSSRFARLTLNFSKSADALRAAVALHCAHHNYCRPHITLKGETPAQRAGIEHRRWEILELLS